MYVIAVVGMCGSGKTLVTDVLKSVGWESIYFGSIVIDAVKEKGLQITPENENKMRESIRKECGQAAFAERFLPIILELMNKHNVVIDGLYTWSEYKYLKKRLKEQLRVLCILTDRELRYKRIANRMSRQYSYQEAIHRDYDEIETLEKGGPIAMADKFIINNGSKEELRSQVMEYIISLV